MTATVKVKYLFILSVVLFFSCRKKAIVPTHDIPCVFSDSSMQHPKYSRLVSLLEKYKKQGLPGISVLLANEKGICIDAAGYADIEEGIRFSPCHISKAASITKLLMSTLTLRLQEKGVLDIDDPLEKYIDQTILKKIKGAEGKTIRHLLNHTSGIYDLIRSPEFYMEILNNPDKSWTQTQLLPYIYNKSPETLGNPYNASYSNSNYLLLSMCLESATGIKHETLLENEILQPLGMQDTYYQGRESIPVNAAQGYFDLHNNGTIVNVSNIITGSGNGFGGIYSNVFDLYKFTQALLIEKNLLSQTSLNEMMQFIQEDDDYYCGLGMIKKFTNKSSYGIGHTGKDLGYTANLFYFPDIKLTLIWFVNYGTNGASALKQTYLDFENELVNLSLE